MDKPKFKIGDTVIANRGVWFFKTPELHRVTGGLYLFKKLSPIGDEVEEWKYILRPASFLSRTILRWESEL